MQNLFLVGSRTNADIYLNSFIGKTGFNSFDIERYEDKILVETARDIKISLSRKSPSPRLFVLTGEMTIGSQNALLKCLEEAQENVYFTFYSKFRDGLLPTVVSRCKVIDVGFEPESDGIVVGLVANLKNGNTWNIIDTIFEYFEGKDFDVLLPSLRKLVLDTDDISLKHRYYAYCKNAMRTLPLLNNNINRKIVIEKIFSVQ